MNIFFLDRSPETCAQQHCDKHVLKMIIEYAQLLCTSHRVIDGEQYVHTTERNHKIKRWKLDDEREQILHLAAHVNHPSNIWTRTSTSHYSWLYDMWRHLLKEYTYRYGKQHSNERLIFALAKPPQGLTYHKWMDPPKAMDDIYKKEDPIESYRNFYINSKSRFARWTKRDIPDWYIEGMLAIIDLNPTNVISMHD
jgi:hypothetical protein